MTKLDQKRRLVGEEVKKFEHAAREIHELADKMHKKMQEMHGETKVIRQRALEARKKAQARSNNQRQTIAKDKPRKAS